MQTRDRDTTFFLNPITKSTIPVITSESINNKTAAPQQRAAINNSSGRDPPIFSHRLNPLSPGNFSGFLLLIPKAYENLPVERPGLGHSGSLYSVQLVWKKNTHNTRQTQVVKFLERYSPLIVTGQFLAASLPLTNFRNVHVCTIF